MILALLTTLAMSASPEWRLIAAYDFSAASASSPIDVPFVWRPPAAMSKRCGPAKSPDGLGVFEAEAIASGMTPTLAIVLEAQHEDAAPLGTHNVAVAVGYRDASQRVRLQPALAPRQLRLEIAGDQNTERYQKLVRAQFDLEACMEHKTGRGWMGGLERQLKQAFMLEEPSPPTDPSRKYFGGQIDPVAALLGPPATCLQLDESPEGTVTEDEPDEPTGRGESSMQLVATDVWGARLPRCGELPSTVDLRRLDHTLPPPSLPLILAPTPEEVPERSLKWRWEDVSAELRQPKGVDDESAISVRMRHVVERDPSVEGGMAEYRLECPLFEHIGEGEPPGLTDLLARLPYWYPEIDQDGRRRVVLLVPNWQIVEAMRRLESLGEASWDAEVAAMGAGEGTMDAVGFLLSNPELLYVQVPPAGEVPGPYDRWSQDPEDIKGCAVFRRPVDGGSWTPVEATKQGEQWLNLATAMALPVIGQPLGYTVGILEGRSPIALSNPGGWPQVVDAQRSWFYAIELASFLVLAFVFMRGVLRISDLWTRAPEERADYWPGANNVVVADTEANSPGEDE